MVYDLFFMKQLPFIKPKLITYGPMCQYNNAIFGSIEAYWISHKPIHIAFKLSYYVPNFTIPKFIHSLLRPTCHDLKKEEPPNISIFFFNFVR